MLAQKNCRFPIGIFQFPRNKTEGCIRRQSVELPGDEALGTKTNSRNFFEAVCKYEKLHAIPLNSLLFLTRHFIDDLILEMVAQNEIPGIIGDIN